jgi:hypothetical protein
MSAPNTIIVKKSPANSIASAKANPSTHMAAARAEVFRNLNSAIEREAAAVQPQKKKPESKGPSRTRTTKNFWVSHRVKEKAAEKMWFYVSGCGGLEVYDGLCACVVKDSGSMSAYLGHWNMLLRMADSMSARCSQKMRFRDRNYCNNMCSDVRDIAPPLMSRLHDVDSIASLGVSLTVP